MSRLILKSPYLKSGTGSGGYMQYIATREGVELLPVSQKQRPVTQNQKELIDTVIKDFPDTRTLPEYKTYQKDPTVSHASAFIIAAVEENWDAAQSGLHLKYIATRPHVEKSGMHGLFGDDNSVDLKKAMAELEQYQGRVWTHIISLRREDAARLGYDNAKSWRNLLKAHRNDIAEAMKINPNDFRWYAAFHNEGEHPHVHMMAWSAEPRQGYLNKEGISRIRSKLTNSIFKQDLLNLYEQKSDSRDELAEESRQAMAKLIKQMKTGFCDFPEVENLMVELVQQLQTVKGKKQYGYLPKKVKQTVKEIVDLIERVPAVAQCYCPMAGASR